MIHVLVEYCVSLMISWGVHIYGTLPRHPKLSKIEKHKYILLWNVYDYDIVDFMKITFSNAMGCQGMPHIYNCGYIMLAPSKFSTTWPLITLYHLSVRVEFSNICYIYTLFYMDIHVLVTSITYVSTYASSQFFPREQLPSFVYIFLSIFPSFFFFFFGWIKETLLKIRTLEHFQTELEEN